MLTFFDYLRQRAFESVLSGAQDALDALERQKSFSESKKQLPNPADVDGDDQTPRPRKKVASQAVAPPPTGDDKPIPSPRDQGRPKREAKGKK